MSGLNTMRLFASLAVLAAGFPAGDATAGPTKLFQQDPCELVKGTCVSVTTSKIKTGTVRSYAFTIPGPGVAMVNFLGSMACENTVIGTVQNTGIFDFDAMITTSSSATPDYNDPSGARWRGWIPTGTLARTYAYPVPMYATRRIPFRTGGKKTVYFRYGINQLDQGVECFIYSAAFNVTFVAN